MQADPLKASHLYKEALVALQSASPDASPQVLEEMHRVMLNLAATARCLGKPGEVISHCTASMKLKPNFARAYMLRGVTRKDLGENAAACADLSRTLELEPENREAQVWTNGNQSMPDVNYLTSYTGALHKGKLLRQHPLNVLPRPRTKPHTRSERWLPPSTPHWIPMVVKLVAPDGQ